MFMKLIVYIALPESPDEFGSYSSIILSSKRTQSPNSGCATSSKISHELVPTANKKRCKQFNEKWLIPHSWLFLNEGRSQV